jgi:hypothetical protein
MSTASNGSLNSKEFFASNAALAIALKYFFSDHVSKLEQRAITFGNHGNCNVLNVIRQSKKRLKERQKKL